MTTCEVPLRHYVVSDIGVCASSNQRLGGIQMAICRGPVQRTPFLLCVGSNCVRSLNSQPNRLSTSEHGKKHTVLMWLGSHPAAKRRQITSALPLAAASCSAVFWLPFSRCGLAPLASRNLTERAEPFQEAK